jgi:hypothetical protein
MPSLRRRAWILTAALLTLAACKNELDDKPAVDPLDDPWVDAIETGDEEQPAVAATPAEAAPVAADPAPIDPNALAIAEAGDPAAPDPATGVLATPTASGASSGAVKSKPGNSGAAPAEAIDPVAPTEPTEQPAAIDPNPAPAAEPTPAPTIEPEKPATPPPITIADFHGNYRYSGGSAQRTELEAAIEAAANTLAMAIRGIGRKRLTKTNPIDDTLDIVIAGDKVTTIFETGFDATCVIDGATIHWSNDKGDTYKVRVRSKGSKLVQVIEDDDGVKTTVFVLSSDKQKLTVHHKIEADRLPEPMTYRLSYSRK